MKTNDYISSGTFAKLGSSKANIFVTRYKIVTAEKGGSRKTAGKDRKELSNFLDFLYSNSESSKS